MKTMFLAAAAALLMLGGAAQAEPFVAGHAANDPQEAAALARTTDRPSQALNEVQIENPTGLPAYEMRPDGLMINGLLPAQGWEG
jgi:hypothetical protein